MNKELNYLLDLIDKCDDIEPDSSGGSYLEITSYEVMPYDYLKFAEDELEPHSTKSKINVISNLKRAIDCQIDIFLDSLHFKNIFDKNNLKFEQKAKFLAGVGLLSTKSINKLNSIRNKMEHEYIIPSIEDLQIYYDLVWYVIEIIQAKLLVISTQTEIRYIIFYNDKEYSCDITYQYEDCGFVIVLKNYTKEKAIAEEINIEIYLESKKSENDFIQAFKFYLSTLAFQGFLNIDKYKSEVREIKKTQQENLNLKSSN